MFSGRLLPWCFLLIASLLAITSVPPTALAQPPEVTDRSVADQIDDELLFDSAVNSARIDIQVDDGIVTLRGSVANLLAKERAGRIAESVKGVRAVVNRIEVAPAVDYADERIGNGVEAALAADSATEAWEVTATVEGGNVTLTGQVDSWQEKQLAEKVVKSVNGVRSINNDLKIDYTTERSDQEVREEIERALEWNIFVDDALIDVMVEEGEVKLSGTVGSAAEKSRARQLAWVAGVTNVEAANLNVEKWARDPSLRKTKYADKTEEEIKEAVEDALLQDPRVFAFDVTADVAGSFVTLRGTVDNLKAKRAAAQVARSTVGVSSVVNRIKVRTPEGVSDEKIEESVTEALENDVHVDRFDITTVALNGIVHLYGDVDTLFEKTRAEDKASRVYGVVDVRNHLDVDPYESYSYDPYVDYDDYYYDYDYGPDGPYADTTLTDFEVEQEIEDEMFWSPFVDADEISVQVDNGVATMSGTVDTWAERQSAEENAYEGGATSVINKIDVEL